MKKKPLCIAISSQKGGVGKSTITTVLASVFHYARGYNVAVVDCDDPQHSVHSIRQRDLENVQKNEKLKIALFRQYERIQKRTYPIIPSRPEGAAADLAKYISDYGDSFDIVLFDLPGSLKSEGVVLTISEMDYVFVPIIADNMVMQSSLQFAEVCTEELVRKGNCNLKGVYTFWNRIDRRERQQVFLRWCAVMAETNLKVLQTKLPDTKKYSREASDESPVIFRSTIFPPDASLMAPSGMSSLADEIIGIIRSVDDGGRQE